MHELSIAEEIITLVEKEMGRLDVAGIEAVGIRIGSLAGVDPEALTFAFEAATKGTDLDKTRLKIEMLPVRGECRACRKNFEVCDWVFLCPYCASPELRISQGHELDVSYLDTN
jgi:hydrogenase nickel incorporation protein HypA/HybF